MVLNVRVIPRAAKNAVGGWRGDALVIRLAAPPVEGAANDALVDYLAELFEQPRRSVQILSGHKSRDKRVSIHGLTREMVEGRLSIYHPRDPR